MNRSHESSQTNDALSLMPPTAASILLAPLCEGLHTLNVRVAEEYFSLAALLQSNSVRARQITAESHKATGSGANLQSSRSVAILQRILTESAGINKMVEISAGHMRDILTRVNATRVPLQNLAKMPGLLQTVGVLARIEGGRITNNSVDLSSFSRDIDVLAKKVQQHVGRISSDASTLSEVLRKGVAKLRSFEQQESLQSADLIQRTQSVLGPMLARSEVLQAAARDIDEQYASFHSATDQVVMSLQAEDIARQRVEHVQEAIRRVAASLDAGASMESCAGVLTLQRSQLLSTRELLADSIRTIQSALHSLGPRIQALVSETATLAQQTGEDGQSFASVIDNGLDAVSGVFKQCSSSMKALVSIVNSVRPSVEQMTSSARALKELEESIHLISVNAILTTAQLHGEGLAMGVIASELRTITTDRDGDTKIVREVLAAISEALEKITHEEAVAENSLMMDGSGDVISAEFSGLSQSVETASQEMTAGLTHVRQLAEALCSELERGRELASRALSITALYDEQLSNFDQVFAQLGYTQEMAANAAGGDQADGLSKLYSMESERMLHLQVFGGEAIAEANPSAAANHGSEFGDDVELF